MFVVETTAKSNAQTLNWPSAPGRTYTVMRTESLMTPFTPIATGIQATPPLNSYVIPEVTPTGNFMVIAK